MPTPQDQERIGTLLAVLSGDQDFVKYKHKITDAFIAQAEQAIIAQRNCINNSGRFMALIKCIPTSPKAVDWLTKCNSAVFDQAFREYQGTLMTNALCSAGMKTTWNNLKVTLAMGF
ncbi:hypothetical protein [Zooshikella ganghwensis]|uniref:Uncharacterized protein n=1 Tax=Zooshikella ganghwensis TaxID=202772 RepID=A0A4P9VGI8_9GAMM|nr:hypothetical protein [Zooshikella ganghwensis]RDH41484.1 hypothetical protein B9G39_28115 [Zooshikella ganghwensis]RDH41590.1 hypothetical protein B9G39_27980 [Zooshikella ganghwensis]